jgi:hypothetical protein
MIGIAIDHPSPRSPILKKIFVLVGFDGRAGWE